MIALTLYLYVLPVCFTLSSHDSIFWLLKMKVSNLWEKSHMCIWTCLVSSGNLLEECQERILENDICFCIPYGILFLHFIFLFHPSNHWLHILHELDISFFLLYFIEIESSQLYTFPSLLFVRSALKPILFLITKIFPLFSCNLFLWGFHDFLFLFLSNYWDIPKSNM